MSVCFEKVVTFNVLSILSAAFAVCLLSVAIPGAIIYGRYQLRCVIMNESKTLYGILHNFSYEDCYTDGMVNMLTNLLMCYFPIFLLCFDFKTVSF